MASLSEVKKFFNAGKAEQSAWGKQVFKAEILPMVERVKAGIKEKVGEALRLRGGRFEERMELIVGVDPPGRHYGKTACATLSFSEKKPRLETLEFRMDFAGSDADWRSLERILLDPKQGGFSHVSKELTANHSISYRVVASTRP